MRKIKLLHILYSGQGGLGTYFMNFVNSDQNKCFEHYTFFYGIEPLNKELENFCLTRDIPYTYIERVSKIDWKAVKTAIHFIEYNQIRWVMLHTFSLSLLTLVALFKKWKVIAIDHTTLAFKTNLEKMFTAFNHMFASKMIYFYEGHFEQNNRVFPFLQFGRNSHVIPKSVDVNFFTPRKEPIKNPYFTLGMTSRLIQGKRHELIIEAITKLRDEGLIVQLNIAGGGPKEEELKEMVSQLNLKDQVTFTGILDREELLGFYQTLDAYIHASEGETICYSIMEAQACGLPVIASDVEGINNILSDNNGYLFKNDLDSLVLELKNMIDNTGLYSLGLANVRAARSNYNKYNNANMLYDFIIIDK